MTSTHDSFVDCRSLARIPRTDQHEHEILRQNPFRTIHIAQLLIILEDDSSLEQYVGQSALTRHRRVLETGEYDGAREENIGDGDWADVGALSCGEQTWIRTGAERVYYWRAMRELRFDGCNGRCWVWLGFWEGIRIGAFLTSTR